MLFFRHVYKYLNIILSTRRVFHTETVYVLCAYYSGRLTSSASAAERKVKIDIFTLLLLLRVPGR